MNQDNPAGRLLNILKAGKQVNTDANCRETWRKLLLANGDAEILSRLGLLMELSNEAAVKIREDFPNESGAVNHWSSQLTGAFFSQNIQSTWQSFISNIDQHSLNYLASHSTLLALTSTTKPVADEDIMKIKDKLVEISDEILESEINIEIKKYLIRYLRKIITSIDEYFLTGALPILEAVETTIGHAHVDKEYKNFLLDTDLGKQLLDTLAATANVVTVAVGLPQLTTAITLLIANV